MFPHSPDETQLFTLLYAEVLMCHIVPPVKSLIESDHDASLNDCGILHCQNLSFALFCILYERIVCIESLFGWYNW